MGVLILLDRLERHCGITANAMEWFSSYLEGWSHSVSVDGTQSSCTELIWGVAQGSVLGAILYMIYVNQLDAVALFFGIHIISLTTRSFAIVSWNRDHEGDEQMNVAAMEFSLTRLVKVGLTEFPFQLTPKWKLSLSPAHCPAHHSLETHFSLWQRCPIFSSDRCTLYSISFFF